MVVIVPEAFPSALPGAKAKGCGWGKIPSSTLVLVNVNLGVKVMP